MLSAADAQNYFGLILAARRERKMRSPDRDRDPSKLEWLCQLVGYEKEHILPTLFRAMLDLVSSQSFLFFIDKIFSPYLDPGMPQAMG